MSREAMDLYPEGVAGATCTVVNAQKQQLKADAALVAS